MSQLHNTAISACRRNPFGHTVLVSSPNLCQANFFRCKHQHEQEWNKAQLLTTMPKPTRFSLLLNLLPGGKLKNLSFIQLSSKFRKELGDIFALPTSFNKKTLIVTFSPEDFEKIHRVEGNWPNRPPFETLKHYRCEHRKDISNGAKGLLIAQGEEWERIRKAVNPVLKQPRTIRSYIPRLSKLNWDFIQKIKEIRNPITLEAPETFEEDIKRYIFASVFAVALDKEVDIFGSQWGELDEKFYQDLCAFSSLIFELEIKQMHWKMFPTAKYRQLMQVLDGMTDFVSKSVEEAAQRLEKSSADRSESEKGILEKLLRIDRNIATVMAMDMLLAGVDTTTTSLTGVLLALAKNPEKQQNLRNELRQALPQKDTPFTEASLKKMPYLRACIKESLRIYPVVPGVIRVTDKDVVLSGFRVPKGSTVSMINYMAKDDPKYFNEPEKFLPERWLRSIIPNLPASIKDSNNTSPTVYWPFGFGRRTCVGRRIAEFELEITVARLVRNFNLEFNYPVENAFIDSGIFVPAIPLKLKFTDVVN